MTEQEQLEKDAARYRYIRDYLAVQGRSLRMDPANDRLYTRVAFKGKGWCLDSIIDKEIGKRKELEEKTSAARYLDDSGARTTGT